MNTPLTIEAEAPKERWARITIRNPGKRMVRLEICGEPCELGDGEGTDLCLADRNIANSDK